MSDLNFPANNLEEVPPRNRSGKQDGGGNNKEYVYQFDIRCIKHPNDGVRVHKREFQDQRSMIPPVREEEDLQTRGCHTQYSVEFASLLICLESHVDSGLVSGLDAKIPSSHSLELGLIGTGK